MHLGSNRLNVRFPNVLPSTSLNYTERYRITSHHLSKYNQKIFLNLIVDISADQEFKRMSMFTRLWGLRHVTQAVKTRLSAIETSVSNKLVFPEKYKGTIYEKWAKYWQQLGIDYKDVFVNVAQQMKEKPILSSIYCTTGGVLYYCVKNNPTEEDFLIQLRQCNADAVLVQDSCLNDNASGYIQFIEKCYNQGIIRHLSLGFISFLWLDNYASEASLYKATCKYTDPQYLNFHERVIDVGFMNKWWNLSKKMKDYDVNY